MPAYAFFVSKSTIGEYPASISSNYRTHQTLTLKKICGDLRINLGGFNENVELCVSAIWNLVFC